MGKKGLLVLLCIFGLSLVGCGNQGGSKSSYLGSDNSDSGLVGKESKVLSDDLLITNAPDDQSQPDAAYDTINKRYLVVWADNRAPLTNGLDIYGAFVNGITNAIDGSPFRISNSNKNESQPKVAFDEQKGQYLVVWTDTREGVGRIYGQFINADGNLAGSNFLISQGKADDNKGHYSEYYTKWIDSGVGSVTPYVITITDRSQESPSVIFNKVTGNFVVAWVDSTDREQNYFFDWYEYSGSSSVCTNNFGDNDTTNDTSGDANIFFGTFSPSSVSDTNMVRYREVTYEDYLDGDDPAVIDTASPMTPGSTRGNLIGGDWDNSPIDSEIFNFSAITYIEPLALEPTCTPGAESLTLSAKFRLMDSESSPALTYNPVDGTIFVAWSGKGKTVTMNKTWSRTYGTTWSLWSNPKITYATSEADANMKIYLRTVVFDRANDLILSGSGDSYKPALAVDPYKKRLLAVWENNTTTNGQDIIGKLVDLENNLIYGNPIEICTLSYAQTSPKVAFDTANQRYFVIWEDDRNGSINMSNMDIFGQFIDPKGDLSGSNFPVTVYTGNQIDPAIVFGDSDMTRFLTIWKDGRKSTDSDIYGQFWYTSANPALIITDSNDQEIYTQTISFGSLQVSQKSIKVFRLWNKGNAPLNIISVTNSPNVSVGTDDSSKPYSILVPVPTMIMPGTYYEMSVQFSALTAGNFDGSITIDSDGGKTNLYFNGVAISPSSGIDTDGGGTGGGTTPPPSSSSGGESGACFIATA